MLSVEGFKQTAVVLMHSRTRVSLVCGIEEERVIHVRRTFRSECVFIYMILFEQRYAFQLPFSEFCPDFDSSSSHKHRRLYGI